MKFSISSLMFLSSVFRSVRTKMTSANFSLVPGLKRLWGRSARQQIVSVLPLPYANEDKGPRFEQTLFRHHFTIKELDRVLTFSQRCVRQPHVVSTKVFF